MVKEEDESPELVHEPESISAHVPVIPSSTFCRPICSDKCPVNIEKRRHVPQVFDYKYLKDNEGYDFISTYVNRQGRMFWILSKDGANAYFLLITAEPD